MLILPCFTFPLTRKPVLFKCDTDVCHHCLCAGTAFDSVHVFLAIKIYFSPLRDAIATMENIRNGKLNSKLQETQFIREFSVFNSTFNRMMDEIHNLKIRTYENKLIIQKSQLQYFQIQLKPHFYLNCLKTLYGMIQQNKGNDAQQMILYVSQYIRYTLPATTAVLCHCRRN